MTDTPELERENVKLRAFAIEVLSGWPSGDGLGCFDLQELAVEHGLLAAKEPKPTAPCSEDGGSCPCAEYFSDDDWKDGVICYQRTALLTEGGVK